jgi:hypothetical protein
MGSSVAKIGLGGEKYKAGFLKLYILKYLTKKEPKRS